MDSPIADGAFRSTCKLARPNISAHMPEGVGSQSCPCFHLGSRWTTAIENSKDKARWLHRQRVDAGLLVLCLKLTFEVGYRQQLALQLQDLGQGRLCSHSLGKKDPRDKAKVLLGNLYGRRRLLHVFRYASWLGSLDPRRVAFGLWRGPPTPQHGHRLFGHIRLHGNAGYLSLLCDYTDRIRDYLRGDCQPPLVQLL